METDVLRRLTCCPLFDGMDMSDIDRAIGQVNCRVVNYAKHQFYTLAGEPCLHADVVLKGTLSAKMVSQTGRQVEVIHLKKGDVIAPCFIHASNPMLPVELETETPVMVLRMTPAELRHLVDSNDIIRWNYIRLLSDIGAFLASRIRFLSLMTVREKAIHYICMKARQQQSMTVVLDKSRQKLAEIFGVQKFSLVRCLAELAAWGAIRVEGRMITIIDRHKMRM